MVPRGAVDWLAFAVERLGAVVQVVDDHTDKSRRVQCHDIITCPDVVVVLRTSLLAHELSEVNHCYSSFLLAAVLAVYNTSTRRKR